MCNTYYLMFFSCCGVWSFFVTGVEFTHVATYIIHMYRHKNKTTKVHMYRRKLKTTNVCTNIYIHIHSFSFGKRQFWYACKAKPFRRGVELHREKLNVRSHKVRPLPCCREEMWRRYMWILSNVIFLEDVKAQCSKVSWNCKISILDLISMQTLRFPSV
jgi:hypothetical protein